MYLFMIYLLFYHPKNKSHTQWARWENDYYWYFTDLETQAQRSYEMNPSSQNQWVNSTKIWIEISWVSQLLSFHTQFALFFIHLPICFEQTLTSIHSILPLCEKIHEGGVHGARSEKQMDSACRVINALIEAGPGSLEIGCWLSLENVNERSQRRWCLD